MPDEQAEHFGKRIDLALEPLSRPGLPVKPWPEALVQFRRALALEPGIERIGQYLRLRRSRAGGKRVQLRRQVIGKIEFMACLEGFHGPQDRPSRDRVTVPPWCRQAHVKGLLLS